MKPLGPYSLFKIVDNFVFISGQIGINEKGEIPQSIEEQTINTMKNIIRILSEIGLTPSAIVKTTIFLKDMKDFEKVNEIYSSFFKESYPARTTVAVSDLPKGAKIEIETIAKFETPPLKLGLYYIKTNDFLKSHEVFEEIWRKKKKEKNGNKLIKKLLIKKLQALAIFPAILIKIKSGEKIETLLKKIQKIGLISKKEEKEINTKNEQKIKKIIETKVKEIEKEMRKGDEMNKRKKK